MVESGTNFTTEKIAVRLESLEDDLHEMEGMESIRKRVTDIRRDLVRAELSRAIDLDR